MSIAENCELFFLYLVVKKRLFFEYVRVIFRYYPSKAFRRADLALLFKYFLKNPYKISREFLQKLGEDDPYTYGETPLTTLETIAKECEISSQDTVYELGCGRGRNCFWLSCYLGCQAVGIEYIPEFVAKAELVKEELQIPRIDFYLGDILEADYSRASVLYFYGVCHDDFFIKKLTEKLAFLPKGTRIITVSYSLTEFSEKFELIKQFKGSFTWGTADIFLQEHR